MTISNQARGIDLYLPLRKLPNGKEDMRGNIERAARTLGSKEPLHGDVERAIADLVAAAGILSPGSSRVEIVRGVGELVEELMGPEAGRLAASRMNAALITTPPGKGSKRRPTSGGEAR